uniref:Uncharacterized protein n=1 Tax=Arundo donax TaxID=35708 RepID=A0A0A8XYP3_ARUDO
MADCRSLIVFLRVFEHHRRCSSSLQSRSCWRLRRGRWSLCCTQRLFHSPPAWRQGPPCWRGTRRLRDGPVSSGRGGILWTHDAGLGALPRGGNLARVVGVFGCAGIWGGNFGHCWSQCFSLCSSNWVIGSFFGYSWRCS